VCNDIAYILSIQYLMPHMNESRHAHDVDAHDNLHVSNLIKVQLVYSLVSFIWALPFRKSALYFPQKRAVTHSCETWSYQYNTNTWAAKRARGPEDTAIAARCRGPVVECNVLIMYT